MKKIYFFMKTSVMNYAGYVSMSKMFIAFTLLALVYTGCKDDDDDDDDTSPTEDVSQADRDFAMKAALSNRAEIELGELAATRAQHDSVKAFARLMINEHTTAQNELATLAQNKQISLPTTIDSAHQALKNQLMAMSGNRFDSTYISTQVVDHQRTQQDFQTEINQGQNGEIKNYANKYLPHINMHLDRAVKIKALVD